MNNTVFSIALIGAFSFLGFSAAAKAADDLQCDKCVQKWEIADDAVTSYKIKDGTISTRDLSNAAVGNKKLKNGAVDWDKLASALRTRIIDLEERLSVAESNLIEISDQLDGFPSPPPNPPIGTCRSTRLMAANGAFIACDPVPIDGGPALTFELQGRTITYNGTRITGNAFTMYSEPFCKGRVGLHDHQGAGIVNVYGISRLGDVYISDGTSPISWTRRSKVLNASGTLLCRDTNLGNPGVFYDAELILDHRVYPTPYTISSEAS